MPLKDPTVLVVEDDAGMREFLKNVLAPEGFAVYTADTGQEGIKQALTITPDLVLLDLLMPTMDGVAVCKALRTNKETENIPILVVTGTESRQQIEESMTGGADDFVSKPIDVRDLLVRVRAMLQCKQIADPVERLSRYVDTVRQMTGKPLDDPTE